MKTRPLKSWKTTLSLFLFPQLILGRGGGGWGHVMLLCLDLESPLSQPQEPLGVKSVPCTVSITGCGHKQRAQETTDSQQATVTGAGLPCYTS